MRLFCSERFPFYARLAEVKRTQEGWHPNLFRVRSSLDHFHNYCKDDLVVSHPFHKEREMDGARKISYTIGKNALDRDAGYAGGDSCENFPWDCVAGVGVVVGGDRLSGLRSNNCNFVAGFDAGDPGHVEDCMVHADAADKGSALAADEETEAVTEGAVESVGVAHRNQREPHGLSGSEGSVVADDSAGGNGTDAHDGGLPGEHGLELRVSRSEGWRLREFEGRVEAGRDAVEREAGAQHRFHPMTGGDGYDCIAHSAD